MANEGLLVGILDPKNGSCHPGWGVDLRSIEGFPLVTILGVSSWNLPGFFP